MCESPVTTTRSDHISMNNSVHPLRSLFLLSCWVLSVSAFAQDRSAEQWLDRAADAMMKLNYQGAFVYLHGNQLEAMYIVHRVDQDGEHERLVSLNGAAREVLRNDNVVTCILPDNNAVVVDKSRPKKPFPARLPQLTKVMRQYYEFSVTGQDRVAGRTAKKILVQPKDQYRYGYRYWVDEQTAVLLKSDILDEHGVAIEQVMFTDIEIRDQIPESELLPTISGEGFVRHERREDDEQGESQHSWQRVALPKGFILDMYRQHRLPASTEPVEHIVFTDGLATVSVYIEAHSAKRGMLLGKSNMGAVNAFGVAAGQKHVTVVGEVPAPTVVLIGESVQQLALLAQDD